MTVTTTYQEVDFSSQVPDGYTALTCIPVQSGSNYGAITMASFDTASIRIKIDQSMTSDTTKTYIPGVRLLCVKNI